MNRKFVQSEDQARGPRMNFALSEAEAFALDSLRERTGLSKARLLREAIPMLQAKYAPKERRPRE